MLREKAGAFAPSVSLIIPLKNEENNLPRLFNSLERQTYSNFEIILVNDRSDDSSPCLVQKYQEESSRRVTIVTVRENPSLENPKQYALLRGIQESEGDILLFTDADCKPVETWISSMVLPFYRESVGVVFAPVHTEPGRGFLKNYQVFDHVFRFFYNVGSAGIGNASGVFGNNMAVRRTILDAIGGYDTISYSVTEDNALITAVREKTAAEIIPFSSPDVKVKAAPQHSWRELTSQELRWSTGAFFSPDIFSRFGYSLVKIYLAAGTAAACFSPLNPLLLIITCSTILSMSIVAVTGGAMLSMSFRKYWILFLPAILWSMIYYIFVDALSLLRTPVHWKGNRLKKMKVKE